MGNDYYVVTPDYTGDFYKDKLNRFSINLTNEEALIVKKVFAAINACATLGNDLSAFFPLYLETPAEYEKFESDE